MRAFEFISEHQLVWQKNPRTQAITKKWRCTSGPRINRTVPNVADCSAAPDMAKSQRMKTTRRRTFKTQARRSGLTKIRRPMSKLSRRMNKIYRPVQQARSKKAKVYKWKRPSYVSKKSTYTFKGKKY